MISDRGDIAATTLINATQRRSTQYKAIVMSDNTIYLFTKAICLVGTKIKVRARRQSKLVRLMHLRHTLVLSLDNGYYPEA